MYDRGNRLILVGCRCRVDVQTALDALRSVPRWAAYLFLFGGAFLEYVFPPFPGDTVVLAAAALMAVFGWPFVPVFVVITAGSVVGGGFDYAIGRWMERTGRVEHLGKKKRAAMEWLLRGFEKHGVVYLVLNRLLPGVRALFFIAAGTRRFSVPVVLGLAAVSAVGWNALLVAVGYGVGSNIDALERFATGSGIVTGILVVALIGFVYWKLRRFVARRTET